MAEMHRQGRPPGEIARKFGLSKAQVSRDLKEINKKLFAADASKKDRIRAEILAENRLMKKMLWEDYKRSREDKEVQYKKKITSEPSQNVAQNGGNDAESGTERLEGSIRTETQYGNRAIIDSIGKCLDREAKLWGVNEGESADHRPTKAVDFIEAVKLVKVPVDESNKVVVAGAEAGLAPAEQAAAPTPPDQDRIKPNADSEGLQFEVVKK